MTKTNSAKYFAWRFFQIIENSYDLKMLRKDVQSKILFIISQKENRI